MMKCSYFAAGALAAIMTFAAPAPVKAQAGGERVDLTYAADQMLSSVVYIKVTTKSKVQTMEYSSPFDDFFSDFFGRGNGGRQQRQVQVPPRRGAGSGVVLTADGYIVTNNHVVEDADEIEVKTNDNHEYRARIIGCDRQSDLAVIKIEATGLRPAKVGSSDQLKVGEWVLAIGNPYGLTSTVTAGIVSAKARGLVPGAVESFIQTDAAINPGNSGGALVNVRGELVGINAMLYSQTGSFAGYGFAIPTTIVKKVVDDLKKYGTVQRAVLGLTGVDVETYLETQRERENEVDLGTLTGVYVQEVLSAGAVADVLQVGDVVTALNGTKVTKMAELSEQLVKYNPGDKVSLTYIRDKKERTVQVTLRNAQGTTSQVQDFGIDELGAALRPLTATEKRELNLSSGLVVTALRNGKMQEAGVTKGIIITKINDREMKTLDDFEQAVRDANMSTDRVLWIRAKTPSGINRSFTIELSGDTKNKEAKK